MGFLTALKETFVGDDSEASGETAPERDHPATSFESGLETDSMARAGVTRKETLLELVTSHGGRVQQAELVDFTGWSKSSVSRELGELETDGAITRRQFGRYKVVFLPDHPQVSDSPVADDTRR